MADFWVNLGVVEQSSCLKKISAHVIDGRIAVGDVRHAIDTAIGDVPLGPAVLATYKSEIVFLWEQLDNAIQETEKLRLQCSAAEVIILKAFGL